jgi:hypothetical protein
MELLHLVFRVFFEKLTDASTDESLTPKSHIFPAASDCISKPSLRLG